MPIRPRITAGLLPLLAGLLFAGCATKMTAVELDARLDRASRSVAARQAIRRVFPIHAQTKMEAWVLLSEAQSDPESSPLSLDLADGFRLGQRQRIDYVVGGPFPELADRLVLNGLRLNTARALPGLRIVFVSPEPPTSALRSAASEKRVRLEHRVLD